MKSQDKRTVKNGAVLFNVIASPIGIFDNAKKFANDIALVEINPDQPETRRRTWHEFELVEPTHRVDYYRREISWAVFNEKANRLANMLQQNGIGKGKKVADATPEQSELIYLIVNEIKSDLL
jgi:acyl-CoA synthetase (AMP-forming)/AMP-acid ligase II